MLLPLVMLVVLGLVLVATILLMGRSILRPPRMTDGKAAYRLKRLSPGDLGMQFENAFFAIRDVPTNAPLELAAWWIANPGGGDKAVILIHGYADAKVGAIAWAPVWRALGYHILAIDLRAHGESGGRYTTAGALERYDLDQVINQLRATRPQQTARLVLFGVSMGAAVALATAELRDDLAAVVVDSPFAAFERGVRAHIDLLGLPLPSMLPIVMRVAAWMSGANWPEVAPVRLLKEIRCPVLVIMSSDDPFLPAADRGAIEQSLTARPTDSPPAKTWLAPDAGHLQALARDPDEYLRQVETFLHDVESPVRR